MRLPIAFLIFSGLLSSCNPQGEQVTLGPPATKALKTAELANDAQQRLSILANQTDLQNNSLFTAYRPKTTSQWNSGWTRRLDFTGVSWTHRQAGTAITPRHIVFAAHYLLKTGRTITFHDRSGAVHSRKIEKVISFRGKQVAEEHRSDIAVALLDRPLPPSIKTYRLLPPRSDYGHALVGNPVIITEQGRRAFIHKVRRQFMKSVSFGKNEHVPQSLYKNLIKGDSGHPSFLLIGGELVLIETHTGGGSGSGPFYSNPLLFKGLEKAVAELDPRYKIKTVPLDPELAPAPPQKKAPPKKPQVTTPRVPHSPPTKTKPSTPQPRLPRVRRVPAPQE
ncbi:MAG: hypothetical protein ACSHYB_13190 [Roseibacillus sp.]